MQCLSVFFTHNDVCCRRFLSITKCWSRGRVLPLGGKPFPGQPALLLLVLTFATDHHLVQRPTPGNALLTRLFLPTLRDACHVNAMTRVTWTHVWADDTRMWACHALYVLKEGDAVRGHGWRGELQRRELHNSSSALTTTILIRTDRLDTMRWMHPQREGRLGWPSQDSFNILLTAKRDFSFSSGPSFDTRKKSIIEQRPL